MEEKVSQMEKMIEQLVRQGEESKKQESAPPSNGISVRDFTLENTAKQVADSSRELPK